MIEIEEGFLVGMKFGGFDFVGLKAEQIELLGVGLVIDDEAGFFGFEGEAVAEEFGEKMALWFESAEGIEDGQLFGGVKEGLMIVGSVDIDEPIADGGEGLEGSHGAIDELAIGAGAGAGAFEDELILIAGLDTVCLEEGMEGGVDLLDVERGFDGADVSAAPDEIAIGAAAQDEIESADENGFAGAGFAGDGVIARFEFEAEVSDQGQVFNSEMGQHWDEEA